MIICVCCEITSDAIRGDTWRTMQVHLPAYVVRSNDGGEETVPGVTGVHILPVLLISGFESSQPAVSS